MNIYTVAILACWMVFILVWALSALFTVPSQGKRFGALVASRVVIALIIVVFIREVIVANGYIGVAQTANPFAGITGVLLAALGIAFAIWARFYIGRNWNMPMMRREGTELVTTGPYHYVRHPIYTGVILALLGTALVVWTLPWLIVLVLFCAYFVYSARQEERYLLERFPESYPDYRARTHMLIPYLL